MKYQGHSITLERWASMGLAEQMANVGAEVGRAINWKNKGNEELSRHAFYRALDLLSLSKRVYKGSRLQELCRLYEVVVDYFAGENVYGSSDELMNKYFYPFNLLARR